MNLFTPMKKILLLLLLITASLCPLNTYAQEQPVADSLYIDSVLEDEDYDEFSDTTVSSINVVSETRPVFLPSTDPRPDPYQLRALPENSKAALKKDEDFWYADYDFGKAEEPPERKKRNLPFVESDLFQTLLWICIVAAFAGILIMYLYNNNAGLFRRSRRIKGEEETLPETDDIFAIDYDHQISKAAAAGNYRLATRLLYLRLLRTMADKNIIQYKQDRTNLDYLMQLSSSSYYKNFFSLTRNYEYVWYGLFDIDSDKYERVRSEFNDMHQTLTRY